MPFDGLGNFIPIPPPSYPAVPNTIISSTHYNAFTQDLMGGLTNCVTRDGQSPPTAILPMGGFRHTAVSKATQADQYARWDQIQDGQAVTLLSVAGTNTITASINPGPSAYTTGMRVSLQPTAQNTGAATLNINGLGAVPIVYGAADNVGSGELKIGYVYELVYNGASFVIAASSYINYVVATTSAITQFYASVTAGVGPSIVAGVGFASVSRISVGQYRLVFSSPFVDTAYALVGNCTGSTATGALSLRLQIFTTTHVDINIVDRDGNFIDPTSFSCILMRS